MIRSVFVVLSLFLLASTLLAEARTADEQKVWSLENAYWKYVQSNDLNGYRALWHPAFLGWPMSSDAPVRTDHITDWMARHTDKHEQLTSYELSAETSQATGNVIVTAYRIRMVWAASAGAAQTTTARILHTWLRGADGNWQIISGMSAPVNAEGK